MTSVDNFFGGPPTYAFADDVRMGQWCGGVISDDPFKQQRTSIENQGVLLWWDEAKTRGKMQLVLQIDSSLGAVPERVDANDDGLRRLFVKDSGDLNKAVKAALAQVGARSIQRGGVLYVCNTGRRPSKMKGGQDARTFQAAYQPPTPEMLARLDAKRPQAAQQPDGFFGGPPAPVAPPAAPQTPFAGQPSAAPWQPQAAPPAPAAAPPVFQPQAAAAPPAASPFPAGTPQYQPQTYQQPAQPVQQPAAPGPAGPPNPFATPVVAPAATEQYPGQAAAQQTPPWAQPGYVAGQPAPQQAAPPNPFQQ